MRLRWRGWARRAGRLEILLAHTRRAFRNFEQACSGNIGMWGRVEIGPGLARRVGLGGLGGLAGWVGTVDDVMATRGPAVAMHRE